MARIANFTSAGTPATVAPQTLDALMARAKELQQQGQQITAPREMTSPWQGAAQMAQQFVNARQESSTAQTLADERAQMAKLMAGIDLEKGGTPEQISQIGLYSPDQADKVMAMTVNAIQARRAQEAAIANREDTQQAAVDLQKSGQEFTGGQNQLTREATLSAEKLKAGAAAQPKISDISGVRQDVISDPSYKNMAQAVPIWSSMQDAATRDTPQADLNMVIALAKLFDPTSVVRQSESGAVELTGNLPAQLAGQFKYLTAKPGSRLPEEVRQGMLAEGWSRVKGYSDAYKQTSDWYGNLANESGIPVDKVVPSFGDLKPYEAPQQVPVPAGPDDRGTTPSSQPQPLPSDLPMIKPNVSYTFPDGRTGVWNGTGNIADQTMWKFTPAPGGG